MHMYNYIHHTDDFNQITTTLTFSSSQSRDCVNIGIIDEDIVEFNEVFTVSLSEDNVQIRLVAPIQATVTIQDTDGKKREAIVEN